MMSLVSKCIDGIHLVIVGINILGEAIAKLTYVIFLVGRIVLGIFLVRQVPVEVFLDLSEDLFVGCMISGDFGL